MRNGQKSADNGKPAAAGKSTAAADNGRISAPSISLPRGGGAIRGMGEKFAANPVTGTGAMSVPIAASPGRSGFGPQLSLSYDSGAGNGPFGFGWSLSLPAITRKTDKGLPKYQDTSDSDLFILSGAEDLVSLLIEDDGKWKRNTFDSPPSEPGYTIERYRPRIEGLFARLERWTRKSDGDTHWRSITKDNLTTLYGKTTESRIADPADTTRIFSWLICESHDDKGNAIFYKYKEENSDGVDSSQAHEKNRPAASRSANRYLKRIKYGNRTPRQSGEDLSQRTDWLFEVVFDYGEHYTENDQGQPTFVTIQDNQRQWENRQDPFSSYRAGFDVRAYRLCRRVLMFHHFPDELDTDDYLVRTTEFTYTQSPIASFITQVTQLGYVRRSDETYMKKSLPPVEFEYSKAIINEEIHEVDSESLENLPYGLDGGRYQWMDLDNEGIQGILTDQAEAWFYKRNLSPISFEIINGHQTPMARFAPVERVASKPSLADLNGGQQQFMDLAGDGQVDLVQFSGSVPGYYERTDEGEWETFVPFASHPQVAWNDPNLKFVDLTGDGHADILITEDEALTWHPSLAEEGFGPSIKVSQSHDEEKGPKLIFADGTQSIYLADMSGDGLTDLVRIRNGEVCYWPNLGYGRFGAKVTMDDSPWFDSAELFDQRRIRLADIDGSGVTDIIYLGRNAIHLYFNQSGNRWSERRPLNYFPATDNLSSVTVVDLFGNGTACLVWSSPLPGDVRQPMRYMDLMGGQKPHLMIETKNNLGAETVVHYAASTKFYLADKDAGKPWITRLPFPVHVVERVETYDRISRNRFVTRYAYHHGYFDGVEREFRGFGMVEQFDTEEFTALSASEAFPTGDNIDAASNVPPVHTKTWFHTGIYLGREHISDFFAGLLDAHDQGEYYREPGLADAQARQLLLDDTVLPDDLTVEEEREACRALKGSMLRQEVYALDGTEKEKHPYTVAEQNFTIRRLQPQDGNRHAVIFTHAREAINYHYERNPADPRVQHALTLEVDEFGNVLKSAAVGYGRRQADMTLSAEDQARQTQIFITYTENRVTNAIDGADDYRTPLPCEARTYELTGYTPTGAAGRFQASDFVKADPNDPDGQKQVHVFDSEINYEEKPSNGKQRRLIEKVRMVYRPNDCGVTQNSPLALLPLGTLESLALPGESYKVAFTAGLAKQIFVDSGKVSETDLDSMLANECKYVHSEGDKNWWIPAGRVFLSPNSNDTAAQELAHARQHFFLPHRYRDPFHTTAISTESFVAYDGYDLLMLETRDALGNRVTVGERDAAGNLTAHGNDYRVLQSKLVTEPNENRTVVAFDALGMVVGTAVMGKPGENKGDRLDETFVPDLDDATILSHLANPFVGPHSILARATTRLLYDLTAYQRTKDDPQPKPAVVYTLACEIHYFDLTGGQQTKIQHSFSYSDGFGREIQKKIQAEPGPVNGVPTDPRWVGSGWTIFNNKGKPVKQYEPFFSSTQDFEFGKQVGVSSTLFYDPVERVVATLHPNHTYEKVIFDPWRQETWDVNDTVLLDPQNDADVGDFFQRLPDTDYLPTWHEARKNNQMGAEEKAAADKTAAHADTPTLAHFDTLGRSFLTVADNATEGNQREVIDAKDRIVMRYDYDMLSSKIHQASMEAGERRMLNDLAGKPIRAWDSRGFMRRMTYDALSRPLELFVDDGEGEKLAEKIVYGEAQGSVQNHRGKVYQQFDGAGVVTNHEYDFKGNLLRGSRQLLKNYKDQADWLQNPALENETFTSSTTYDALNRPVTLTTPDNSVIHPTYNEANLLERVEVNLRGAAQATTFVNDIDYSAKGQRELIEYGYGVTTTYNYDEQTFRLTHLQTLRDSSKLQDLFYTYDPVGNITSIRDEAQQTIYFDNQVVSPSSEYVYDAIYRLISAEGREHIGQQIQPETMWNDEFRVNLQHPNDGNAMRRYSEHYEYDEVGNILEIIHQANNGNWTRTYAYNEFSLIEPAKKNNCLTSTTVGATTEAYSYVPPDGFHGNMTSMPHLQLMAWNFEDLLQMVDLNGGGKAYYVYDAGGQRVRKVWEKAPGLKQERIYLGGFEIFRKRDSSGAITLERETLHIMDDKQRIALVETRTQGNDDSPAQLIRYQFSNHLGTASLELDDGGLVNSYEEYYPFGGSSYQAVRKDIEVPLKRYRYTGKERDEESGLYYYGVRYYACWLGRWTSCDPKDIVDGINLFVYTRNNSINLIDPSGAQTRDEELPSQVLDLLSQIGIPSGGENTDSGCSFFDEIGNLFNTIWNGIEGAVSDAWNWTKGAVSTAWDWTKSAVGTAWNWLKGAVSDAWDWTKGAVSTAWNWTKNAVSTAWNWLKGAVSDAWDWIKGAASSAWDWTKDAASWTWNWVLAPLIRTATNTLVGAAIGGIPGAIAGAITGAIHGWRMADAEVYDWNSPEGWAMFLADNTWSVPNSTVASIWALLNIRNPTDEPLSKGTGQLVFQNSWVGNYATTLGNVTAGRQVPRHERSHALQARLFGPLFFPSMIVHYAINTVIPYWLVYHKSMYPHSPITSFGEYFSRGVYPHTWAEEWAYSIEGSPP